MRGLNALACSPRQEGYCVAGGLGQLWSFKDGKFDSTPTTSALVSTGGAVDTPTPIAFRIRDIRFAPATQHPRRRRSRRHLGLLRPKADRQQLLAASLRRHRLAHGRRHRGELLLALSLAGNRRSGKHAQGLGADQPRRPSAAGRDTFGDHQPDRCKGSPRLRDRHARAVDLKRQSGRSDSEIGGGRDLHLALRGRPRRQGLQVAHRRATASRPPLGLCPRRLQRPARQLSMATSLAPAAPRRWH